MLSEHAHLLQTVLTITHVFLSVDVPITLKICHKIRFNKQRRGALHEGLFFWLQLESWGKAVTVPTDFLEQQPPVPTKDKSAAT